MSTRPSSGVTSRGRTPSAAACAWAAALRRGIKEENLAEGFRISGLGQLIESGIQADRLVTFGGLPLTPARVECPYIIRVAIALLMVAASIPGRSVIENAHPVKRAHPRFVENLVSLGAQVAWSDEA